MLALVAAPILKFEDAIPRRICPKFGLAEPTRRILLRAKPTAGMTNTTIAELAFGDVKEDVAYVRARMRTGLRHPPGRLQPAQRSRHGNAGPTDLAVFRDECRPDDRAARGATDRSPTARTKL